MFTRYHFVQIVFFLALAVLLFGLFHVQVVDGEKYRKQSEENYIRLVPLEASRGRVFDRKGRVIATNRASYNVAAFPEDVTPEVYPKLAKLLGISEDEIKERMRSRREYPFAPAVIQEDISRELLFAIEENNPELPGVFVQVSGVRYYPYGDVAANIIGYIGKINKYEYEKGDRDRFGMNSVVGRAGIERSFDDHLRGWRGGRQIQVNAKGQLIQVFSEKKPEPGKDLNLTIDLALQKRIMSLIRDKKASVAVLDLKTEGLLALASTPTYDPNVFVSPARAKERMEVLKSESSPLIDRGVHSSYPPGSIFKLVTAFAGLATGKITEKTRFYCSGKFFVTPRSRAFKCWNENGHGSINLYEAIERSCNVFFYNLATKLKPSEIAKYARELGLGESFDLEIAKVVPGLIPDKEWKKAKLKEKWYQGETLNMAIGQGYVLVAPIQILKLVSIIALNGKHVAPHLVEGDHHQPATRKADIPKYHFEVIKKAMFQVVESPYGTGQLARVDFANFAAKTGTAQAPPDDPHAWMTGFFPYEKPEIAIVAFVERGGSGGITAAEIIKQVLETYQELNLAQAA